MIILKLEWSLLCRCLMARVPLTDTWYSFCWSRTLPSLTRAILVPFLNHWISPTAPGFWLGMSRVMPWFRTPWTWMISVPVKSKMVTEALRLTAGESQAVTSQPLQLLQRLSPKKLVTVAVETHTPTYLGRKGWKSEGSWLRLYMRGSSLGLVSLLWFWAFAKGTKVRLMESTPKSLTTCLSFLLLLQ